MEVMTIHEMNELAIEAAIQIGKILTDLARTIEPHGLTPQAMAIEDIRNSLYEDTFVEPKNRKAHYMVQISLGTNKLGRIVEFEGAKP
jgi:hypothetical protein